MELLPGDWATKLHEMKLRSYSQWVEPTGQLTAIWHLRILDDLLGEIMISCLEERKALHCHYADAVLTVTDFRVTRQTLESFAAPFLDAEVPDSLVLRFKTPTTHKSQKEYVLFPSPELIGQSIQRKLEAAGSSLLLADPAVAEKAAASARIHRYALQSEVYSLEGSKIIGYTGFVELHFSVEKLQRQLSAMLFSLGEWCGVGIKTSLGMGGCDTDIIFKG